MKTSVPWNLLTSTRLNVLLDRPWIVKGGPLLITAHLLCVCMYSLSCLIKFSCFPRYQEHAPNWEDMQPISSAINLTIFPTLATQALPRLVGVFFLVMYILIDLYISFEYVRTYTVIMTISMTARAMFTYPSSRLPPL